MLLYRNIYLKKLKISEYLMLFILTTFPFLNLYATPIKSVGISDLLLLIMLIYYIVVALRERMFITSIFKYRFLIICLIVVNYLIVMYFTDGYMYKSILLRTLRFIIYMSVGLFFQITPERRKIVRKIINISCIWATLILVLENIIFKLFGVYILGFIPGIPLMPEEAIREQVENIYMMGGRPFSIFSEPSAYGMYVGLGLALEMFASDEKDKFFLRWFLTVGLILSGSTTGLASVIIIYLVLFIKRLLNHNMKFQKNDCLFVATLLPLVIYVLLSSSSVQSMIARIADGNSSYDRIEGFKIFGNTNYSFVEILFGHGMNDNIEEFFMSSYPRLYYYWGVFGIIMVGLLLLWLYKKVDRKSKVVIWFILFLNIATGWSWGQFNLVSYALLVPMVPMVTGNENENEKMEGGFTE